MITKNYYCLILGRHTKTLYVTHFLLQLSSNPIKTINGDAFKGIKAATLELDLSNCTLEVFPKEAINKLPNLMSLLLKNNRLSSIPEQAFNRLKKLETIDLSGNRRLTLDENSFSGLETTLANVSLNEIGLTEFPADALKSLNKLQQLELDGNAITTLPAEIFKGFSTRTKKFRLSIRNNRMNFINSRAFADMGNLRLESLNLQGNRLTRLDFLIDPCSLSFTLGAFVKVRDNPINCDCDVYSAIVTEYTHVDGKCTEPRKYSQFWLNPSIDSSFRDEAAVECTDTNVTAVVNCERDGIDSSVGLFSSLTVTLFSSLVSFVCVMTGL